VPFEKCVATRMLSRYTVFGCNRGGGGVHSGRQIGHYGDLAVDESPLTQRLASIHRRDSDGEGCRNEESAL
jgi:hypothetical protein